MKKIYLLFMLFIIIVITIVTFIKSIETNKTNGSVTTTNNNSHLISSNKGLSYHFYNMDDTICDGFNFQIEKEEHFKKKISIGNFMNEQWSFKLIAFVDFNQTSFSVNDRTYTQYDFELKADDKAYIPVELPDIEAGSHDILFVIANYPDVKSLDIDFRRKTNMMHIVSLRCNLVVGTEKIDKSIVFEQSYLNNQYDFDFFTYNRVKAENKCWYTEQCHADSLLDYNINVGNSDKTTKRYAVISLLDWEQIPINNSDYVKYIEVGSEQKIKIPSEVHLPDKEGIYDLCSILVMSPYEKLNYSNYGAKTGFRVGLSVK